MKTVTIAILMMLAIVTGIVRYHTGLLFPTVFFLLITVAFFGVGFFLDVRGGDCPKTKIAKRLTTRYSIERKGK